MIKVCLACAYCGAVLVTKVRSIGYTASSPITVHCATCAADTTVSMSGADSTKPVEFIRVMGGDTKR
jgi:hypothetical protein